MAKRKSHNRPTSRYNRRVLLWSVAAAIVMLCLFITVNSSLKLPFFPTWDSLYSDLGFRNRTPAEGELKITVLDVGNADSILLQCDDEAMLIDAGENNDEETVLTALRAAGVTRLNYVIATHADADHIGGMDAVIRDYPIDTFLMSFMPEGHTPTTRTYEKMLQAMLDTGVTPIQAEHGARYKLGNATVTILSGIKDYDETNDQSVVCLVSHGQMDFLFMGDAGKSVEQDILSAIPTLDVEVLKVGHHGSSTSSGGEFVRRVSPEMAIITCGLNNTYRHPHAETLQTLDRHDVTIYRSDIHGDVTLYSDGAHITVQTEKGEN